jgi:hypothetical protein
MAYKLIDKHDRTKLSEGRSYGFGGAFAKIDSKTKSIELVMPITCCGDFLNEVVHTEYTNKQWSIYGFSYQRSEPFNLKKGLAYMVCAILKVNRGDKYATYDKDLEQLEAHYKNIAVFMHFFENLFCIKNKTKIKRLGKNSYLFTFDVWWTKGTYKISLYKLLSRMALYYDGKQDPMEYLDACKDNDTYIWKNVRPKVLDMLSGFIPEQIMLETDSCPHSLGVQNFKWPRPLPVPMTVVQQFPPAKTNAILPLTPKKVVATI